MAVLHISTTIPDDIDPPSTPLVRSLRSQDRDAWRVVHERIGAGSAVAVEPAPDDGLTFVDHRTELDPRAVGVLLDALSSRPDAAAVYADGCEIADGMASLDLRPAWSPDLLRTRRYTGDPLVVRAAAVAAWTTPADRSPRGRHELALRLAEDDQVVLHVPAVLSSGPALPDPTDDAVAAVDAHLRRTGRPATAGPGARPGTVRLTPLFDRRPSVAVIIPTAGASPAFDASDGNGRRFVERCLRSLDAIDWPDLRVIAVVGDEYDGDPRELERHTRLPVQIVSRPPGPFSFADAINAGVLATDAELVVFLNDDTEAIDGDWLAALAVHAVDQGVGAVGAALVYPDDTVQHAGVAMVDARPLHSFVSRPLDRAGPRDRPAETRNVIAVTAACMMMRRSLFLAVGAMSTGFPLSFNDTDLCLRLGRCGRRVVFEPTARLVHHESASRIPSIERWEWDRFVHRWGDVADPYYHPAYDRPDDPDALHRNADHLPPTAPMFDPRPRDERIHPRVHHQAR